MVQPSSAATASGVAGEASAVVGGTPMVALRRLGEGLGAEVVAKLEYLNPGGSVKDRIGVAMIDAAERNGSLAPAGRSSSRPVGNTGIALALVCAARGYDLVLTMPEGMSRERSKLLRAYGPRSRDAVARRHGRAIRLAEEIVAERGAFMPQQFSNPANRRYTAGRRLRRSGPASTARSTRSSPASARAARSPASARS